MPFVTVCILRGRIEQPRAAGRFAVVYWPRAGPRAARQRPVIEVTLSLPRRLREAMKLWGLAVADLAVLAVYLLGITALGLWMARRVKTIADFFMPRRFGRAMMMMHTFGTGTHSDQAVSVAAKSFGSGLSGIWYQWLWLFCTPFYWLIAPVMRRFRALTTADVFEARYNRSVATLFAVVGVLNLAVSLGVMLRGSGAVIAACTGGAVSTNVALCVITVLFVSYGVAGGLAAAIVTDFVQGILTIVFSFILLPFILNAVGGLSGLHEKIADPQMFSLVAPAEIGVFYIAMISLNGLIGIVTQPHTMGLCAAGRTELEGQFGYAVGAFLKRFCTVAWSLTGLAAVAYFAHEEIDPDNIYGMVARDFLPALMPGLLGVFLASLLASVMSTCDSLMIASSALFTENIYKPLAQDRSAKHYVRVARIAALVVVTGGVVFAFRLRNVVEGLETFWKISPMMGLAFWLGLFWRRTTPAGAWAATLTGFGAWWISTKAFFVGWVAALPFAESLRFVVEKGDSLEVYLPWQMVFYLSAGTLAGIVVSLLTRQMDEERLDSFYALIRTPVRSGEVSPAPCTLPENAEIPPKRLLFPGTGLEILVPSPRGMIGFAIGWALVAAIILGVALIAR